MEFPGPRTERTPVPGWPSASVRAPRLPLALTAVVLIVVLAACSGGSTKKAAGGPPPTKTTGVRGSETVAGAGAGSPTTWLCRPGAVPDPCVGGLSTAVVPGTGAPTNDVIRTTANSSVDCFFVYPTVSAQVTANATLAIDPAEKIVAREEASPFSQVCRMWAPMYRQVTLHALGDPGQLSAATLDLAYGDVRNAWLDYLAHHNAGRPFVLIGHSQGAAMLIRLIQDQVDDQPAVLERMQSALLLGGNVTVPVGRRVGGSFQHVPACQMANQTRCVVAYSSFLLPPPPNSLFGRPGTGVSGMSAQSASSGLQVLCVNPAAPSGGEAPLAPRFSSPTPAGTATDPWVTYPGLYTAACLTGGGASWLQVNIHRGSGDTRPVVAQNLGPAWGLHIFDMQIAMGDLVGLVRSESGGPNGS